ncbi:hypothetical protein HAX54_012328 [Datura stramonium]|uniref:Uncharacterized protein n=1 Tax=Datura stramonium TaxID=4076 RepID=A0ABS8TLE9_DATST|nr:hypothetical protein [Datura stramonium]
MSSSKNLSKGKVIATSKAKGKGKTKDTPTPANTKEAMIFCVPNMSGHYVICEGRSIIVEKRFDLAGLRGDFPNITTQFTDRQRQENRKHRGKVEDFPFLPSVLVRDPNA